MHSVDFILKVRELYKTHKNYEKVAQILKMRHSSMQYMVKNNYNSLKKSVDENWLIPERKLI